MSKCMGCQYAVWDLTKSGKLHPGGRGRCTWTKSFGLPASMMDTDAATVKRLLGTQRWIERHDGFERCDTFQPVSASSAETITLGEGEKMERAYTVSEIDYLRRVIANKWLFGGYGQLSHGGCSHSFRQEEMDVAVEQLVRTSMLAGHTAEDLLASERPLAKANGE